MLGINLLCLFSASTYELLVFSSLQTDLLFVLINVITCLFTIALLMHV